MGLTSLRLPTPVNVLDMRFVLVGDIVLRGGSNESTMRRNGRLVALSARSSVIRGPLRLTSKSKRIAKVGFWPLALIDSEMHVRNVTILFA